MLSGQTAHGLTAWQGQQGYRIGGEEASFHSQIVCVYVVGGRGGEEGGGRQGTERPTEKTTSSIYVPAHLPSFLGKPQHISGPLAPETLESCL